MILKPRIIQEFHVFLASPKDLSVERMFIRQFFDEYNRITAKQQSKEFTVIDYENYSTAGIGSPQDLINYQTLEKYRDSLVLVIGLIGQRLRNESGTEKEFEWAMRSYLDEGFPQLKLFFRKIENFSVSSSNPDEIQEALNQWKRVQAFRKIVEEYSPKQLFYKEFVDVDDFKQVFRQDISLWLNSVDREWNKFSPKLSPNNLVHKTQKQKTKLKSKLEEYEIISFSSYIKDDNLKKNVEKHFRDINNLNLESAENEEQYINARKDFFNQITGKENELIESVFEFYQNEKDIVGILVSYEIGRVFTENRRANEGFKILQSLEGVLDQNLNKLPKALAIKILDGIGEAARFCDNTTEAMRLYKKAEKLDEHNYFVLKHLGTIFRIGNDFSNSESYFKKALSAYPSYHVQFSLGYLYLDFLEYKKAQSYFIDCVKSLKMSGIDDYYRVYLKLAYIYLIKEDIEIADENLTKVINICQQLEDNGIGLNGYAKVSKFAASLLTALFHPNEALRKDRIEFCEHYISNDLDNIIRPVFYCVYNDIRRVLDMRKDLIPHSNHRLIEKEKVIVEEIIAKLHRKHMQFQICEYHNFENHIPSTDDYFVIYTRLYSDLFIDKNELKTMLQDFDTIRKFPGDSNQNLYYLTKDLIGSKKKGINSIKSHFDILLDHGSIVSKLLSEQLEIKFTEDEFKSFTALVTEDMRTLCFEDYFYINETINEKLYARILSKKLLTLDHISNNRLFINPTIGCTIDCNYCYLIEYGIKRNQNKVVPSGINASDYLAAIQNCGSKFRKGKSGTLISLGSFSEPFLPDVRGKTLSIIEALYHLGNPIQIATKYFPGSNFVLRLIEIFRNNRDQLMINLSLNNLHQSTVKSLMKWFPYSNNIKLTVYIKPFLKGVDESLKDYIDLGLKYPNISFVVGSLYVGDLIRENLRPRFFDYLNFERNPLLESPVVDKSITPGFSHKKEYNFTIKLQKAINRGIFHTASCALSAKYHIRDPLKNYKSKFCIEHICPNYNICIEGSEKSGTNKIF